MLGLGRRLACSLGVALLASGTAFAHPGHGSGGGDFSPLHYLSEPEHLLFAAPLVVLVALGARALRSRRRDNA